MSTATSERVGLKKKAVHELKDFAEVFLYLAFFFCAVSTYRMLLLSDFRDSYLNYSFALINAFVIAKIILIGEYTHLGAGTESRSLLASSVWKAFLFGLLAFGFHVVEEGIKHSVHGRAFSEVFRDLQAKVLLARSIVVFCTFIPLIAFRALRRVLGEDEFNALFFHKKG